MVPSCIPIRQIFDKESGILIISKSWESTYMESLPSLQNPYKIQNNRDYNLSHFRDSKTEALNSILPCPKISIHHWIKNTNFFH